MEQVRAEGARRCTCSNDSFVLDPLLFVLQVFMEFAKEQENEEDEVGSLSTTFQWQRLRPDASAPHTDSVVHQL